MTQAATTTVSIFFSATTAAPINACYALIIYCFRKGASELASPADKAVNNQKVIFSLKGTTIGHNKTFYIASWI
jgi:hypothetical protein